MEHVYEHKLLSGKLLTFCSPQHRFSLFRFLPHSAWHDSGDYQRRSDYDSAANAESVIAALKVTDSADLTHDPVDDRED